MHASDYRACSCATLAYAWYWRQCGSLGLQAFFGEYTIEWDVLFAALGISFLPVLAVFLLLSRQFIAGLTEGALK